HGPGQVQGVQELSEMAGLVVLDIHLEVIQQVAAVLGDTEKMDPGAVGAPGAAGRPRVRAGGSSRSRTTRIVFSSGARYRPPIGSHGACRRARSAWLARLIHCPTAVKRSFPAAVNAQTATAIRQASG